VGREFTLHESFLAFKIVLLASAGDTTVTDLPLCDSLFGTILQVFTDELVNVVQSLTAWGSNHFDPPMVGPSPQCGVEDTKSLLSVCRRNIAGIHSSIAIVNLSIHMFKYH
jgi:hypothetical protein